MRRLWGLPLCVFFLVLSVLVSGVSAANLKAAAAAAAAAAGVGGLLVLLLLLP